MTITPRRQETLVVVAVLLAAVFLLVHPAASVAAPVLSRAPRDPAFRAQVAAGDAVTRSPITVERGSAALSRAAAELPAAYDLRAEGRLTAVRDQGRYSTCWAFATTAALESRLLPSEVWDLSEDNLITRSGFGPFAAGAYDAGGNYQMSAAYLARWAGPLTESADRYPTPGTRPAGPVRKHVQGVVLLPARSGPLDNDAIKTAVMTRGAVATQMYFPDPTEGVYDDTMNAFYWDGPDAQNHGVAIVGWDDAYDAGAFAATPPGDGAFLVRNSWGASWGDGGCFWVSYYDTALARTGESMAISRIDAVGKYVRNYGYDRYGWTDSVGLRGTADAGVARFANRFTAKSSGRVAAASFYAIAPGAAYKVYAGPAFGKLTLRGSGTLADAGYRTVSLSPRMFVRKGRPFVVAVRLDVPGTRYPVPLEAPVPGYAPATSSRGQSFVRVGDRWVDIVTQGLSGANVCLRAFTQK